MAEKALVVSEIYATVQGEGKNTGRPITLLRLWGSNISAKYDLHRFSWDRTLEKSATNKRHLIFSDVIEEISKKEGNKKYLLVTGGEPLMQQEPLAYFLKEYKATFGDDVYVEIETNGTIKPIPLLDQYVDHYDVCVLLSNARDGDSGATFNHRVKKECLEFFAGSAKTDFKFMMTDGRELKEVQEIAFIFKIPNTKIWLTSASGNPNLFKKQAISLHSICSRKFYNLSPRLQVQIFDGKRGY